MRVKSMYVDNDTGEMFKEVDYGVKRPVDVNFFKVNDIPELTDGEYGMLLRLCIQYCDKNNKLRCKKGKLMSFLNIQKRMFSDLFKKYEGINAVVEKDGWYYVNPYVFTKSRYEKKEIREVISMFKKGE